MIVMQVQKIKEGDEGNRLLGSVGYKWQISMEVQMIRLFYVNSCQHIARDDMRKIERKGKKKITLTLVHA